MTNRKRATAQDQDLLFKQMDFDIIEEVEYGDNKRRLIQSHSNKQIRYIQLWSSLSKEWRTVVRYNVDEEWEGWKRFAHVYSEKHKNRRGKRRNPQLGGATKNAPRKSRSKTGSSSTKNNRRKNGK